MGEVFLNNISRMDYPHHTHRPLFLLKIHFRKYHIAPFFAPQFQEIPTDIRTHYYRNLPYTVIIFSPNGDMIQSLTISRYKHYLDIDFQFPG